MITQENIPYTDDEIKAMVKTCEKYHQALERAKYALTTDMDNSGHWAVNYIFPELKESEDGSAIAPGFNETKEQALAWLEQDLSGHVPFDTEHDSY